MFRRAFLIASLALLATPALAQPSSGGGESGGNERRLTSADSYVQVPTLSTAVLANGRTSGTLVVDVGMDVPDAALRTRVQSMQPRMVDALRTALATYSAAYYRDRTAPDPDTLVRLMQSAVDRTLGRTGARLLLSNVIYQRRPGG